MSYCDTIQPELLRGTLSDADFQTLKASIEGEISQIQEQIRALDSEVCTIEAPVTQTEREVINFWGVMETSEREEEEGDSNCSISRGAGL